MGRIESDKRTVEKMVRLYCRRKEGNAELCVACSQLLTYAHERLDHCKFSEQKPTCQECPIHCYQPDMRQRMREVMRWSGPRMILYHPMEAIRHVMRLKR